MECRATYHAEVRDSPQLSPAAACLPDLFAWYLLRLGAGTANEMEVVRQAFGAARNLRRRAADFYNRCAAIKQARERLVLASQLVERMRSLDRASNRRDLVRGLNIQRKELLGPVIDSLVGIGMFVGGSRLIAKTM